jgi:hypothetical protein
MDAPKHNAEGVTRLLRTEGMSVAQEELKSAGSSFSDHGKSQAKPWLQPNPPRQRRVQEAPTSHTIFTTIKARESDYLGGW